MIMDTQYKHWLLQATISPPKRRELILHRSALLNCLDDTPRGGTIVIKAPAGYGKSSLLSDWRQDLINRGEYCAWLYLDESDDLEMVIAHLAYAFHLQGIDFGGLGLLEADSNREFEPVRALKTLLAVIERQKNNVSIIFDDIERAEETAFKRFFSYLLRWRPEELTIVLSGRTHPPLDLGDIALRGMLTEIGPTQLQFNSSEIAELMKTDNQHDVELVMQKSAGWPALVQLIRMTELDKGSHLLHGEDNPLPIVFEHYLDENILSFIATPELDALLESSIFKTIPVAFFKRRIASGKSAANILDILNNLPEFITAVENNSDLLRMHPLLRDRLEILLNKTSPSKASALHVEAALWFTEQEQELPALYHASLTGNLATVEEILFKIGGPTWILFQSQSHLRRVNELILKSRENASAEHELALSPLIALTDIISETKIGHLHRARKIYDTLVSQWNNLKEEKNNFQTEEQLADFSIPLARVSLDYYSLLPIDVKSAHLLVSYEYSKIASTPYLQATIWNTDALLANEQSDFPRAVTSAQRAIGKFRAAFSHNGEVHVLLLKGAAEIALGRKTDAQDSISSAGRIIENFLASNQELTFAYNVLNSEIGFQLNPYSTELVDNLNTYIHDKEEKINLWFDYYASAMLQVIDNFYLSGKNEESISFIDKCLSIATVRKLERLIYFLHDLKAYVFSKSGNIQQAINILNNNTRHQYKHTLGWREQAISCEVALLLNHDQTTETPSSVTDVINLATESDNKCLQLRLLFSLAEQQWHNRNRKQAFTSLQSACAIALETDYLREAAIYSSFLDDIKDYYEKTHKDTGDAHKKSYLSELLDILKNLKAANSNNFTEKELAIITELTHGNSDKVIARNLEISPNTVRFHLKNIFKKLGVTNRKLAVEKVQLRTSNIK
ncbi:hypothetical protein HBA55_05385 [Pseudomaricurvus alkylphenolicus]|uniref:helix-turn-helix transcriptional regulator n=1 Tax=Pseudomaricurvus alkylphenolicus TaxID=1306991 RepID=UPI001421D0E5|nr:LuxR C-terminal-related transcriptional regulator [Pseudomaricurvus alkylphenolicus]NIB39008.1 hypothetical protein [Pseudomaricurvus alkylphenolicus]